MNDRTLDSDPLADKSSGTKPTTDDTNSNPTAIGCNHYGPGVATVVTGP